jgi:glycosyltransferase involved in cell wall biosynthesis
MIELYKLCRELRPDIVHTHNPKPGVYGRIAARGARVPLIVNTQHGIYAQPDDRIRRKAPVYALEKLAATCSDVELIQNEEDLQTLVRIGVPQRKLRLLGNGVDLDRFRPPSAAERTLARRSLGIAENEVVCGAIGRLVWEKGYKDVFEAARLSMARSDKVKVIVAGPLDPGKGDLLTERDIALAESRGVAFLGMRDDPEQLYWAMDVYVLASLREGFPRSAMEAAASGLPVVATDIRGCRQVVDHARTGFLVPPRSPADLAAAMDSLTADDGLRSAFGVAGHQKALKQFDQRLVIERTLDAYRML